MGKSQNLTDLLNSRGQKMLCLNIRSLNAHHSQLEADFEHSDIYLLGLVETWLQPHIPVGLFNISGYDLIRQDRKNNKRGGGVGCYIRNDLDWSHIDDASKYNISTSNIEVLSCKIIRPFQKTLMITITYVPPKAIWSETIEHLNLLSSMAESTGFDWVLMGDFNADMTRDNTASAKNLIDLSHRYQLRQLITTPTRITINTQSLLDHIYTNIAPQMTESGVIKYGISDHDLIYIIIKKKTTSRPKKENFTCRNTTKFSTERLQLFLDNCKWDEYIKMKSVNDGWEILYKNYIEALDTIAPLTTVKNAKPRKLWTTPSLLQQIRKRDTLKTQSDSLLNNKAYIEYKKVKNQVKRDTIKLKRNYVMKRIGDARGNPKRYWNELNNLFNPCTSSRNETVHLQDKGLDIPLNQTPCFMNKFFSKVGSNLASIITLDNAAYVNDLKHIIDNQRHRLISWRPINREELLIQIDSININKNSRINKINAYLFKECLYCSVDKVCILFNKILTSGCFPDQWKKACIIPIFKSGNRKQVNNYRPISLLPLIGKLMEKLLHKQIYNFLDNSNFFTPYQGGFRPGLGTTETITTMLEYIYENFNLNLITATVYFDLSKAFDSIDHTLLLLKLEASGITGNCLKLLKNYLTNRTSTCYINNLTSTEEMIDYGVPQGSTLGPLFFIIFINDIANYINNVKLSLYADDRAFYLSGTDKQVIINELSSAANQFDRWCQLNRLTLNQKKTKSVIYTPNRSIKNVNHLTPITIGNNAIDRVHEFKYLGIILDSKLTFDSHIRMIKQKSLHKLHILKKIRWTLTTRDALTLYKGSILPYLDIGNLFYCASNKSSLNSLQVIQNRALKVIYSRKEWTNTETAHRRSKLLTLEDRRNMSCLKYAHTLTYEPTNMADTHNRSLRSNTKILLKVNLAKNRKFERSFVHQSRRIWNLLPHEHKAIRVFTHFKTRTKTELMLGNLNFPE